MEVGVGPQDCYWVYEDTVILGGTFYVWGMSYGIVSTNVHGDPLAVVISFAIQRQFPPGLPFLSSGGATLTCPINCRETVDPFMSPGTWSPPPPLPLSGFGGIGETLWGGHAGNPF